ncbi:MAG: hypothetical protein L0214_05775 [candidate division NC10 bacterium]|nr:hypothetical protein [candidate division NC10 bacterium]
MRCEECGKGFEPKHPRGRFCSGRCRAGAWQKRREEAARARAERILTALLAQIEAAIEEARARLAGWDGASMRTAGPQTPQMPRTASPPAAQRLVRK